jgi:hypothetical protein
MVNPSLWQMDKAGQRNCDKVFKRLHNSPEFFALKAQSLGNADLDDLCESH